MFRHCRGSRVDYKEKYRKWNGLEKPAEEGESPVHVEGTIEIHT
jgi:hypothetical protein